jgi:hypothetical protein
MSAIDLRKPSETNWKRVDETGDNAVDTSDIPPLDDSFFAGARLLVPKDEMTVRMQVGDNEPDEEEESEEGSLSFFEYLDRPNGHEVARDVIKLFADFKTTLLDKTLQEKQHLLEYQQRAQTRMWIVQIVAFIMALSLAGFLTYAGKFDPAFAVLLGTLVGYFFGKGVKS